MKSRIDGQLCKSICFSVRIVTFTSNCGDDGNRTESNDVTRNHGVQADDSYKCILQRASSDS